jgi:hypothetical protein
MALGNFVLSWWFSPTTKLGIYGAGFDINQSQKPTAALSGAKITSNQGLSASLEEGYTWSNMITQHPVQTGLAITDSIIPQPLVVEITGTLSAIKPFKIGSVSLSGSLDFGTMGASIRNLILMHEKKVGISLTTGLYYGNSTYFREDNMAIESLYIPRDHMYGVASAKFQLTLKQVVIVSPNSTGSTQSTTGKLSSTQVPL